MPRVHGVTDHCCDLLFGVFTSSRWGLSSCQPGGTPGKREAWAPAGSVVVRGTGSWILRQVKPQTVPPRKEPSAQPLGSLRVSGGWDDGRKEDQLVVGAGRMLGDESWPGVPSRPASPGLSHGVPPAPASSTSGGLRGHRLQTTGALQASGPWAGVLPSSAAGELP